VGALDFLWKPWGSIELWEQPITRVLSESGVTTQLVTDHPHLFETGGENYHVDFSGWDYVRGHEGDAWRTHPDPSWLGTPTLPARAAGWFYERTMGVDPITRGYDRSRTFFRAEEDFPGPRVMTEATRFLTDATPFHDRWFLFVDEFDPHEPFDTPAPWLGRYEDEPWPEELLIWPPYADGAIVRGQLTEREGRHIRANYGSKLSMSPDIAALFEKNDFQFRRNIIGCSLSHYSLWKLISGEDYPYACTVIFEDDAWLSRRFTELWNGMAADMPAEFDLIYLGGLLGPATLDGMAQAMRQHDGHIAIDREIYTESRDGQYFDRPKQIQFCTYSYIISKAGARALCSLVERDGFARSIDWFMIDRWPEMDVYVTTPLLCWAVFQEGSDILFNFETLE